MKLKKNTLSSILFILIVLSCNIVNEKGGIINAILNNKNSFYYIDFNNYPKVKNNLPIGVFDSGTGGLTVLKAILNYDQNNNMSQTEGGDGTADFDKESFIYLGDQANMPYGNYFKANNIDLLKENIIKDVQFLMSNKYYSNIDAKSFHTDKLPVKSLVIACNTATAYGKKYVEYFIEKTKTKIKVIGVIDAGVNAALSQLKKQEDAIIGVLATVGTVGSKGYQNTILKLKDKLGYSGKIDIFSQGGIGIAESIDGKINYLNKNLKAPRKTYKGPSIEGDVKINKALLDVYNFDFDENKILCDKDCSIMQINDTENYVRYHLVTLMEKIRISKTNNKLKVIILGCTHYPYVTNKINKVIKELFNYKDGNNKYVYRNFMSENIKLIDPSLNTAKELYDYMKKEALFNDSKTNQNQFYISVVNPDNKNNIINNNNFTYKYKYGRKAGQIQEYVKVVPFSKRNISNEILHMIKEQMPNVYISIEDFMNKPNTK